MRWAREDVSRAAGMAPVRRRSPAGPLAINLPATIEPVRLAKIHSVILLDVLVSATLYPRYPVEPPTKR